MFASQPNTSLNKYLKKIPILDDEEQLSAIVLKEELLSFAKQRKTITKDGLPIIDGLGLIVLKTYAYFDNLELYKNKMISGKTAFLKHRNDIIRLILSLNENTQPIKLPNVLKERCISFIDVLEKSSDAYKSIPHGLVKLKELVNIYRKVFCDK